MLIEQIYRHLAVCSYSDLPRFAKSDAGFWNVISILEPSFQKVSMPGFRKIHHIRCYDAQGCVEDAEPEIPRAEHLCSIFRFADELAGEPLLVHCKMGISRSTGVALAIIIREMHRDGYLEEEILHQAPDILLMIRPQAAPNPMILELGLAQFLSAADACRWVEQIVNHPVFFANRLKGGTPE